MNIYKKMKYKHKLRALALAFAVLMLAADARALNVQYFFLAEPGKVFPMLTPQMKKGLIQYHRGGATTTKVENALGGESSLVYSDSVFMRIRSSEAKTVEMRIFFPSKRDTVVAVIETYLLPTPDSKISFYDSQWRPLETKRFINLIDPEGFLVKGTPARVREQLADMLPFDIMKLEFKGNAHDVIVAEPSLKTFLTTEDYNRFKPYLNEKVFYTLNGKKFSLSKYYLK